MLAGLQHARGDYTALMDADLQDPPALLPSLYRAVTAEGYDCAATCRTSRQGEPPIRSFFAKGFYQIFNRISDAGIVDGARDYRLMRRSVVEAVLSLGEYNRFSKGIFGWVGFRTKWLNLKTRSGWRGPPSGPSGSYCSTPLTASWPSPWPPWRRPPCWASSCA